MNSGISLFNKSIISSLVNNKKYLLKHPSYLAAYSKIARQIKRQNKKRDSLYKKEDITVPPIMILSITQDCNLSCAGCYACNKKQSSNEELSIEEISRTVSEAIELGVSIILIAGGEPLMKKGILDIPQKHKDTIFVIFTNGILLTPDTNNIIKNNKNIIPVFSLEGTEEQTDKRRGVGIHEKVINTMAQFNKDDIIFGSSITLTNENYDTVISSDYLSNLESSGSAVTFLIEYVSQSEDDMLYLSEAQKNDLNIRSNDFKNDYNMLIVALPGDEEIYDGCLAAGRGFLHISTTGAVEACPFAPYSDINIKDVSLKEALKSPLLEKIRANHDDLKESKGGCALNENKEWIAALMDS